MAVVNVDWLEALVLKPDLRSSKTAVRPGRSDLLGTGRFPLCQGSAETTCQRYRPGARGFSLLPSTLVSWVAHRPPRRSYLKPRAGEDLIR